MFLEQLRQTSLECPAEWEGRLADGLCVYVRYRSGVLRMGYGQTVDRARENNFIVWESRNELAGCMRTGSMLRLTGLVFDDRR